MHGEEMSQESGREGRERREERRTKRKEPSFGSASLSVKHRAWKGPWSAVSSGSST